MLLRPFSQLKIDTFKVRSINAPHLYLTETGE